MNAPLNSYLKQKDERKEAILFIRAQLRQNISLREELIMTINKVLKIETANDNLFLNKHLTLALDEEINDNQGHVIV